MDSFDRNSRFSDRMIFPSEDSPSSSPFGSTPYLDREPAGNFGSVPFGAPPPAVARRSGYPRLAIGGAVLVGVMAPILAVVVLQPNSNPERKQQEVAAVAAVIHRFAPVKSKLDTTSWIEHGVEPEILDNAISDLRGIDLSTCPSDFRQSFVQYIHACEQFRDVIAKAKADGIVNLIRDMNAGKLEKLPATADEAYNAFQAATKRLSEAGQAVEDVASRY